jgi:antitoxin component YwqK of YwqJK toxin-antitoxin module
MIKRILIYTLFTFIQIIAAPDDINKNIVYTYYLNGYKKEEIEVSIDSNGNQIRNGKYTLFWGNCFDLYKSDANKFLINNGCACKPSEIGQYVNGEENGFFQYFDPKGEKIAYGNIEHGKRSGQWTLFMNGSKIEHHGIYINGLRQGKWTIKDSARNAISEIEFKNDTPYGNYIEKVIYDTACYYWTGKFVNGMQEGPYIYKNSAGKILTYENYHLGKLNGKCIYKSQSGILLKEVNYLNGFLDGKWFTWYASGQKHEIGAYCHGNRDGKWIYLNENGLCERLEMYKEGTPDSIWKQWDEKGRLLEESLYRNGDVLEHADHRDSINNLK